MKTINEIKEEILDMIANGEIQTGDTAQVINGEISVRQTQAQQQT